MLPRALHAARLLRRAGVQRAPFTADGFYRSGDLMRQHPSGNYMVEGRKKDLINRGGEKISAEEIENLILSHPAVQNVACIAMPDPDLGERMCACVIPRDGQEPGARGAGRASSSTKEIAKFKLPERHGDHDRFPALDVRQGVEEDAGRDGIANCRHRGRRQRRADVMRIIDLHCYPNTKPWIACQGPYVEALAEVLEPRLDLRKQEDEVVQEFTEAGVEAVLVALDLETTVHDAAVHATITSAACRSAIPDRIIQSWGAVDPFKGEAAIQRGQHAIVDLGMLGFHFHPIMGHFAVNDRRALSAVRDDRRAQGSGDDRCRHDRHGRRHAGRHGRQDPPRASLRRSTSSPPISRTSPSSPRIRAGPGSTR